MAPRAPGSFPPRPLGPPRPRPVSRRQKADAVLDRLRADIPAPETELRYRTEFELLVAVILSAQCTDKRVNQVTPALFEAYPDPAAMAEAEADDLFPYVRSVSYPNNKAKALAKTARMLRDDYGRRGPPRARRAGEAGRRRAEDGERGRGGRLRRAGDRRRHARVPRLEPDRLGQGRADAARRRARAPTRDPRDAWGEAHHLLILHGRYTCQARTPKCGRCPLTDVCDYYAARGRLPAPLPTSTPSGAATTRRRPAATSTSRRRRPTGTASSRSPTRGRLDERVRRQNGPDHEAGQGLPGLVRSSRCCTPSHVSS